jgi:sarcosine oxidase, subunit beta
MKNSFDAIVIGAGSVGIPISFNLAKAKLKVLTIDSKTSIGQGSNKTAIGGIRATHSDFSKIMLCKRSIEIFSKWKDEYGDEIEWYRGGYAFPVYEEQDQINLIKLLEIQKNYDLRIDWLGDKEFVKLIPDINPNKLRGGTFSPEDGSASPLLAIHAFYKHTKDLGGEFLFNNKVELFITKKERIEGIKTKTETYYAPIIINAAGAWAAEISGLTGTYLPITPDSHEAGITEPVERFFEPMIVDVRPFGDSANFYFYQHITGQVIFCVTPMPNIWGFDTRETSAFLPLAARRLIEIMPKLKNIRVRRTWRGLYPMTPDGLPIIGFSNQVNNLVLAAGMCGQGFMLGPAVGELVTRLVTGQTTNQDEKVLSLLSPHRLFDSPEMLK